MLLVIISMNAIVEGGNRRRDIDRLYNINTIYNYGGGGKILTFATNYLKVFFTHAQVQHRTAIPSTGVA